MVIIAIRLGGEKFILSLLTPFTIDSITASSALILIEGCTGRTPYTYTYTSLIQLFDPTYALNEHLWIKCGTCPQTKYIEHTIDMYLLPTMHVNFYYCKEIYRKNYQISENKLLLFHIKLYSFLFITFDIQIRIHP